MYAHSHFLKLGYMCHIASIVSQFQTYIQYKPNLFYIENLILLHRIISFNIFFISFLSWWKQWFIMHKYSELFIMIFKDCEIIA